MKNKFSFIKFFWVLLVVSPFVLSSSKVDKEALIMQETLASFRILLPLSLSEIEFKKEENRPLIEKHLRHLAKSTTKVFNHFNKDKDERSFLADSMAKDAREALKFYEMKNFDSSRFILHHISENCVSCHSRLPAKSQKHSVKRLFIELKNQNIKGMDLAHFLVMTRKFDDAAKIYETEFKEDPSRLLSKSFGEYLKLKLRVQRDINSVVNLLTDVSKKKTDIKTKSKIQIWLKSSQDIKDSKSLRYISLSTAEKLVKKGEKLQEYPEDIAGIVYFIASSAITQTILEDEKTPKNQMAESYFLAGLVESHLRQSIWINEVEHYFELAITADPKSKWAKLALKKLEEEYIAGYSGSSGTNLPDDIKQNLNRLRELTR